MYPDLSEAWPTWDSANTTSYSAYYSYLLQQPRYSNYSGYPESSNGTEDGYMDHSPLFLDDPPYQIEITTLEIIIAIVLSIFILGIIFGNCCVVLSVLLFREMRTITNGLIVSLATADLLVAVLVLPISLYQEIVGIWTLGPLVCDFWITSDVFCCTSSILNIVVIALDRYWLISKNVRYTHNTTFSRHRTVVIMIFFAWLTSAFISALPLIGWRSGDEHAEDTTCLISQDLGYTVFSTFGAFWFPLALILFVYFKIFRIARTRARLRAKARVVHPSVNSTMLHSEANGGPTTTAPPHGRNKSSTRYHRPSRSDSNSPQASPGNSGRDYRQHNSINRERRQRSRTRSAARTLGLIIGGFVFCWLPFFMLATILPFCSACEVPPIAMSIVLWLGYSNSLLNPAIYAIWDKNFRRSFKRLIACDIRWTTIL